jgi:hypothetical protein
MGIMMGWGARGEEMRNEEVRVLITALIIIMVYESVKYTELT